MQDKGSEFDAVEAARLNPSESFLRFIRRQVLARTAGADARAVTGAGPEKISAF